MVPIIARRFFLLINLVLVTLLVFYGVKIFYGVITGQLNAAIVSGSSEPGPVTSIRRRGESQSPPLQNFSNYKPIITRDLFNTESYGKKRKETFSPSDIANLRKTGLEVKLWGTVTSDAGREYAVIEDTSSREQQLYPEGGSVKNARIKMIFRKMVVLSVKGRDEVLKMEKPVAGGNEFSRGEVRNEYVSKYVQRQNRIRDVYRERQRKKAEIRREMAEKK